MTFTTETQSYDEKLLTLSEGSVHSNFDAFLDVPWDDPAYAIDPSDPRWTLPAIDALGAQTWYQELSDEQKIKIGLWRQANVIRVGLQFENILIRGLRGAK